MKAIRPAGLLRRWLAFAIDGLFVFALWALAVLWLVIVYVLTPRAPATLDGVLVVIAAAFVLAWCLGGVYFVGFVGACGQTPAKMLTGIVVVRRDGRRAGYVRAFVRWLGYGVGFATLGLGFLVAVFSRERRGVHDLLSGTRAVRAG